MLGVLATLVSLSAVAHHSRAMYDPQKTIEITGVVKEFQFAFPHSYLVVDVTDKDGNVTTWSIEGGGPPAMQQAGIKKSAFPPGTEVKVTAHPLRDPIKPRGLWIEVTRVSDGKVFELGDAI